MFCPVCSLVWYCCTWSVISCLSVFSCGN